ncbi:MAG TPA: hypothetical protein VH643_27435 [Gemmataceae bacterium]|jgi:hypothetical protein
MNQDLQHLKLLSIFHYVVGGLMGLTACIPIIHFVIGVMMIVSPSKMAGSGPPPPPALGWFFALFAGGGMVLGWTAAICMMIAGWFLAHGKHYIFCMVMAGFACLFQPFGMVLGIFTIIVLIRPSVKQLFENGGLPPVADDDDEPRFFDDHIRLDSYNIRSGR